MKNLKKETLRLILPILVEVSLAFTGGFSVAAAAADSKLETSMFVPLTVQWQMMQSHSQAALAGTLTESYVVAWRLKVAEPVALLSSPYFKQEVPWSRVGVDNMAGMMLMSRLDLVRFLGIDAELPQDGRQWEADSPVLIFVQPQSGRASETVFRHADDNGTLVIRLSARVASKS